MPKMLKRGLLSAILVIVAALAVFYVFLPPINPHAVEFWLFLSFLTFVGFCPFFSLFFTKKAIKTANNVFVTGGNIGFKRNLKKWQKALPCLILLPIAVAVLGGVFSSTLLFARQYAAVINVRESVFTEDLPESTEITNIALMDTESATRLGDKTLGALAHVVSQYDVSPSYTQINYKGAPKKVANLEYDGFFKWIGNRANGIPGMVMVDPVESDAEYIEFGTPMHYAESAYFNDDLMRALRFRYPTKIFDSVSFEIDENGKPYYIVSCAMPKVSLFGAMDISEVIIFDPTNGSSEICDVADTPRWVDIVYNGYLASEKYNWHGLLSGGYINSIIGNVGCKQATDDFGYIALDDDVWYFTGVTSVTSDKSNIGFILSNARTGEYRFYPVIGAEEHSAMDAAEGQVQEKGYVAAFPSLVNVAGQPTYIMVLKDASGYVKLHALVNVENCSIVATGVKQSDAMTAYKKLLRQNDITVDGETKEAEITVKRVTTAMVSGVATVYVTGDDGNVYKGYLEADEALILINEGDKLKVSYINGEVDRIKVISSWKFTE